MQLHQVAQRATDLGRSVAFYRDVVGLRFITSFDPPGLGFFELGGTRLLLEGGASPALLYLRVDDIVATRAELESRGAEFVDEPHVIHRDEVGQFGPAGADEWMTFFKDPDGNLLALVEQRLP